MPILQEILDNLSARLRYISVPLLVALDGRCAAGKTTLAARLGRAAGAPVFHTDDFYLPFARRTQERLAQPGGHIDYERLETEVLRPASAGKEFLYRPYDAHADSWGKIQKIPPQKLYIVEGSYSLLPALEKYYGYKIFLTLGAQAQQARLLNREGKEKSQRFLSRWIPAEENYFSACRVCERADSVFDTSDN